MQKMTILCTGKLKEKFYLDAVAEYVKRLSRFCKLEIIELPEERLPEDPSPAQIEVALSKEADAVRAKLPNGCLVIAMCVEGRERSSEELARYLADSAAQGASHIVFLIGSSYGMHASLKRQAALRLLCSKYAPDMTTEELDGKIAHWGVNTVILRMEVEYIAGKASHAEEL